eukprot:m.432102 g.432102  ORF g.432102 m.432102 type:complete len:104 (+) comp17389_c0_seq1:840-1151(+)
MDLPIDLAAEAAGAAESIRAFVSSIQPRPQTTSECVILDITTAEGTPIAATLTTSGYTVNTDDPVEKVTYESIEALLDARSPAYRDRFASALAAKLGALSNPK